MRVTRVGCWLLALFIGTEAAVAGLSLPSVRSGLQCDRDMVVVGDFMDEVLAKCGEPMVITVHSEFVGTTADSRLWAKQFIGGMGRQHVREITVEEWIYNFGRNRLRKKLRFENGQLTAIITLGRGD